LSLAKAQAVTCLTFSYNELSTINTTATSGCMQSIIASTSMWQTEKVNSI